MQSEWMMQVAQNLGRLTGAVETGFQAVHRRIEDQERSAGEWRRHFTAEIRRLDKRRNGNGHAIPYAKIATILGLIILGTLGHIAPDAVRSAIAKIVLS